MLLVGAERDAWTAGLAALSAQHATFHGVFQGEEPQRSMTARAERVTRTGSGNGRSAAEGPSGAAAKAEASGRADRSTLHHASALEAPAQIKAPDADQLQVGLGAGLHTRAGVLC